MTTLGLGCKGWLAGALPPSATIPLPGRDRNSRDFHTVASDVLGQLGRLPVERSKRDAAPSGRMSVSALVAVPVCVWPMGWILTRASEASVGLRPWTGASVANVRPG
jgi:hypothetical protein